MKEDFLIISLCYLVIWITLAITVWKSRKKRALLLYNPGLQLIYSAHFILQLNKVQGWDKLGTWIVWMGTLVLHWLVLLVILGMTLWKRHLKKNLQEDSTEEF
ncbi:MAG: hypothetical protein H6581_11140 [Bacteroidia bacterium]|nr:hypothetical protein [Bacteroidia bacterium]